MKTTKNISTLLTSLLISYHCTQCMHLKLTLEDVGVYEGTRVEKNFSNLGNIFSLSRDVISLLRNFFSILRNIFNISGNIFSVLQNIFRTLRDSFSILPNCFSILRKIFRRFVILKLRNRVTRNGVILRLTNSNILQKFFF